MTIIRTMLAAPKAGHIKGTCAHCKADVFEARCILDDTYNVWMGKCPHCGALNYLSMSHGLRGYSTDFMHLELPTLEEIDDNGLPPDTPHRGSGGPTSPGGTLAGQIMHKLQTDQPL